MPKGAVRNVSHSKFLGSIDQAICLVQCLKRRVLCLKGVDFGNCFPVSIQVRGREKLSMLTRIGLAQSFRGAFREANVLGLACLSDLIKSRDRLFERRVWHNLISREI